MRFALAFCLFNLFVIFIISHFGMLPVFAEQSLISAYLPLSNMISVIYEQNICISYTNQI